MKEKNLQFDRKKHVLYSKKIKDVILRKIAEKHSESERDSIWEKTQNIYVDFLKDLPYIGGKSCTHNRAGGTYDCIALFAYYEAENIKPTLDELYAMNNEILLPPFARLGKLLNANKPLSMRIIGKAFTLCSNTDKKIAEKSPASYIMKVLPYDKKKCARYTFERCPIAEFAKAHGYTHLMPAFCNGDYPALEQMHAGLIRETTCSNGDRCDYWVVGCDSDYMKKYPVKVDKDGYFFNEITDPKDKY